MDYVQDGEVCTLARTDKNLPILLRCHRMLLSIFAFVTKVYYPVSEVRQIHQKSDFCVIYWPNFEE